MKYTKKVLWAFFFLMPFLVLNTGNVFANIDDNTDDSAPDVTAKVARISYLRGDVQIRRTGSEDWERASQNLPIVEGDELTTNTNSRIEIQFDTYRFLRLDQNAYLKMTALRDEGISVSLPQGTMNLRLLEFDKDRSYFEIDAPRTTIAVQKAGMYRIDAGDKDDTNIRVTATNGGQARVFSENSGFTLKDGRSAKVFIAGDYSGEWNVDDASKFVDDFDSWALDRDNAIAKRIREANYDKYYDRDVYGAEDLNENGEWIYTRDYGHVWRPYRNATSSYSNWSPYRYGTWRWIPPYGWTWVNDEPWGWATYHHGRWISYDNYWVWSPYGQYRQRRSWWRPALVVITWIGNSICWYPLPYDYGYYNYNRRYNITNNNTTIINNNTTIINNNTTNVGSIKPIRIGNIPVGGVITVDASEFGRGQKNFRTASPTVANEVISKVPDDRQSPPILPTMKDLNGKISKEILIENPRIDIIETRTKTGAATRIEGKPLDEKLMETKVYGNRTPSPPIIVDDSSKNNSGSETRGTGAVGRAKFPQTTKDDGNNQNTDTTITPETRNRGNQFPTRTTGGKSDESNNDTPVKSPRNDRNENQSPPIYAPPDRKVDPPRDREETRPQPRIEPREEPRVEPRQEPTRIEPPKKEEEKPSPPPRQKDEKPDSKDN
jgi:FecR protein